MEALEEALEALQEEQSGQMINQVDQVHFQHNKVDMVAGMRKMMAKKNDRTSLKVMYTLLEK